MATRRMFSKNVIESGTFMDMPLSTQMLYVHISINTDERGVCDKGKAIMRMIGASNDDIKLLLAKKFLIPLDENLNELNLLLDKLFYVNNNLSGDKQFVESQYYDSIKNYRISEKFTYTENDGVKLIKNKPVNKNDIKSWSKTLDLDTTLGENGKHPRTR